MVRSFSDQPVDPAALGRVLRAALRAPTAGHTRATAWVVLEGHAETRRYWEAVTTEEWRARSTRWAGLSRAPVALVSLTSPPAYVERYGEADKKSSGLGATGGGESAWPVPYWWGDAAFAVMHVLLAAVAQDLGACFLGNFRGEAALAHELGVPEGWRVFGTVLLGHPDGQDRRSASLDRPGPSPAARVHHGRWRGVEG